MYEASLPIAWCQFGPADRFPRFDAMRAYQALNLPDALRPAWRIACLFVDKHRRGEGLANFALRAAVGLIRAKGGGLVEAFPLDIAGVARPSYTGSESMYRQEGFDTIARLGKNTLLMRLVCR